MILTIQKVYIMLKISDQILGRAGGTQEVVPEVLADADLKIILWPKGMSFAK